MGGPATPRKAKPSILPPPIAARLTARDDDLRFGEEILPFRQLTLTLPWFSKWRSKLGVPALALALSAALVAACGSSASNDGASPGQSRAGAGPSDAGAGGDAEPEPNGIAFTSTETIDLDPKETRELTVQTDPPGSFLVRFALPGSGGDEDPGDAVLDRNQAQTDASGIAHVVLTAPSTPANFSVRTSAGKWVAFQGVSVSTVGHTTLRVVPSYSGQRPVALWTATATAAPGVNCSQLMGNPPPDGVLSVSALPTRPLNIPRVPVGVDVVVTLRAGHYIGGCATLPALSEGDGNMVLVYASDRPLNLDATHLELAFGPSDSRPAVDKVLAASASLAESALLGAATSDVAALLDEMQSATPSIDRSAFATARDQGGWDDALSTAFGKTAARRTRDPAERWLDAGLATFDSTSTFSGTLSSGGADALFKLSQVAGLAPSVAGFASSFPATWLADSSDTLLLGTELTWVPSRLVTALATAPALLEYPAAASVEEALALSVDCQLVSNVLLVYGANAGSSLYTGCDASCGSNTCATALGNLWQKATLASGTNVASLAVTATGSADVGDAAEVTKLQGSWVGQLTDGDSQAAASGALTAQSVAQ
jgi:hypothetical protein